VRLTAEVKGLTNLAKSLNAEEKRQKKAVASAIKVEGYRLMRIMKDDINRGRAGSKRQKPLSYIAAMGVGKYRKTPRPRSRPISALGKGVRYYVPNSSIFGYEAHVGWTSPGTSRSWQHLADIQQTGFSRPVTKKMRELFAQMGGEYKKNMGLKDSFRAGKAKYFFLKKSTKTLRTPPRPIIDPFWKRHKLQAKRNITVNFRAKMRGLNIIRDIDVNTRKFG